MTAGRCARLGCDAPVTKQNRNRLGVPANEGFSMGRIVRDLEVHHRDWTDAVRAGYFGRPLARAFSEGPPARGLRQTESFRLIPMRDHVETHLPEGGHLPEGWSPLAGDSAIQLVPIARKQAPTNRANVGRPPARSLRQTESFRLIQTA